LPRIKLALLCLALVVVGADLKVGPYTVGPYAALRVDVLRPVGALAPLARVQVVQADGSVTLLEPRVRCFAALAAGRSADALEAYPEAFGQSWLFDELYRARNFKPWMAKGLYMGTLMVGVDQVVFGGKAPWTLRHAHADHETLRKRTEAAPIDYPKPDGRLTFDRLTSVSFSSTNHGEDQPIHLTLKDAGVPVNVNLALYDAPEQRYCPAGVYEIVRDGDAPRLQINAQNCVHCKTCDIKDPTQNIVWVAPEGGGGPNYPNM